MVMSRFLRLALLADAVATAACGVILVVGSRALEAWLQIPTALLFYAGLSLLPWAAFVYYLSAQAQVTRAAVWTVIGVNALWAVDSIVLLLTGWISPSALGYAFVLSQAALVAAFCELQFVGLKKAGAEA